MAKQPIRVGIVGAGANTRRRHIPGFRAIEKVEIVGVVNRTAESTARAAGEFGIPRTYSHWSELVADPQIDAVLIGTWPYLHCEITCAALDAGKHVLTEARIARDLAEARRMLAASQARPHLVTQVVPSPFGLVQHDYVRELLADGFLGELRELVVIGATDLFHDPDQPLHWRQDRELSGLNILSMGILHEAAARWTPPTTRVLAQTALFGPTRPNRRMDFPVRPQTTTDRATDGPGSPYADEGATVTVPDSVQVVTQLEGGGRGLYHLSGVTLFGPGHHIHLYGSRGTIKYEAGETERLLIGRAGDPQLREADIPPEQRGGWRVEAEFIGAIRGEEQVRLTDFAAGLKYMEFTEAVTRSAESDRPIDLPLDSP